MLKVDGGATKNNYLMQLQANILGIPVLRPRNIETTSLGAAFAAGLGAGLWRNIDELRKLWVLDKEFKPIWSKEKREKLYSGWRSAVKRAMKWLDEVGELPGSGAYWE
ncbi:Glycerol kinase [compost metagenome]